MILFLILYGTEYFVTEKNSAILHSYCIVYRFVPIFLYTQRKKLFLTNYRLIQIKLHLKIIKRIDFA